jgi:transcriptional regulator with XRE-family HTH domain
MSLFAERLRTLREQHGWSQRELGRRCNIAESMIQRYERGLSEPVASNLSIIAEQLGVSVDYLLGRTDNPQEHVSHSQITDQEWAILETFRREGWLGVAHLSVEKLAK